MPQLSFRDRVAEYFKAWPDRWIDGRELSRVGGAYGWRTRASECRRQLHMNIENRVRHVKGENGQVFTVSEYKYRPPVPVSDLSTAREQSLF